MAKIRVYELAKELKLSNKDLVKKIRDMGIRVLNHMSSLDGESVAKIRANLSNEFKKDIFESPAMKIDSKFYRSKGEMPPVLTKEKVKSSLLKKKRIKISEGDIGYTYEKLFGEYLMGVECIDIVDPYIRKSYQMENFTRFCELVVKIGDAKKINFITGFDNDMQKKRSSNIFSELKESLKKYGIELEFKFDDKKHYRKIELDNGWTIRIDWGLDIYKRMNKRFCIGSNDFSFRDCKETEVDIYKIRPRNP